MCSTGWFGFSSFSICFHTTFQVQSRKNVHSTPSRGSGGGREAEKTLNWLGDKIKIQNEIHHPSQPVLLHVTLILLNEIFIQM